MTEGRVKLWLGVGAFVMVGAGGLAGKPVAAAEGKPVLQGAAGLAVHDLQLAAAPMKGDGGEGGEGGEQGHEGDVFAEASPDQALVGRLLLLEGHLLVGKELYDQGRPDDAAPHYLHPTEEIYDLIEDELKARNIPQFETALKDLAKLVKNKKPAAEVADQQNVVLEALHQALAQPGAAAGTPDFVAGVVNKVLAQAADEYKDAFVGARIANAVEYQDARGFVWIARRYVEAHAAVLKAKDAGAYGRLIADFDALMTVWPAAVPPRDAVATAGALQAMVSKIELVNSAFR